MPTYEVDMLPSHKLSILAIILLICTCLRILYPHHMHSYTVLENSYDSVESTGLVHKSTKFITSNVIWVILESCSQRCQALPLLLPTLMWTNINEQRKHKKKTVHTDYISIKKLYYKIVRTRLSSQWCQVAYPLSIGLHISQKLQIFMEQFLQNLPLRYVISCHKPSTHFTWLLLALLPLPDVSLHFWCLHLYLFLQRWFQKEFCYLQNNDQGEKRALRVKKIYWQYHITYLSKRLWNWNVQKLIFYGFGADKKHPITACQPVL